MSDSTQEKDAATGTAEQAPAEAERGRSDEPARSGGRGLAFLALLLALMAGAAGGWVAWQQWRSEQGGNDLGARLDRLEQKLARENADLGGRVDKLSNALDELGSRRGAGSDELARLSQRVDDVADAASDAGDTAGKLSSRLDSLEQAQQALNDRLDRLAGRMPESGPSPVAALELAQAEFLIQDGYRSLALDADAQGAVKALEMADSQLAEVDAPGVAAARAALADELEALRAVPNVDVTGLAARLASLAGRVDQFPFPGPRQSPASNGGPEGVEGGWWGATKSFLGDYFTVRRTAESGPGMAAPEARQGAREVLRLELEQARLALLRRDQDIYRASLSRAGKLLRERFDTRSSAVKQALESLDELSSADLAPHLPQTGGALERVREARRRLEGGS